MYHPCSKVPSFIEPSFTPLSIENYINEEDAIEDEENNFGKDKLHIEFMKLNSYFF